jgi:hypothetical protein
MPIDAYSRDTAGEIDLQQWLNFNVERLLPGAGLLQRKACSGSGVRVRRIGKLLFAAR